MTNEQLSIIAFIQGIAEFLPISSSGHLALVSKFTSMPDQGIEIDVALHIGSLFAILLYFYKEVAKLFMGFIKTFYAPKSKECRLFWLLVVATIPVGIIGFYISKDYDETTLRGIRTVGWTSLIFGFLLYVCDKIGYKINKIEHMRFSDSFIIGLCQCLALIPGTSRSGITMSAARILGFERAEAAKYCMLMAIPTIMAAGLLDGLKIYEGGNIGLIHDAMIGAGFSFIFSLFAIAFLMHWVKKASFAIFAVYRMILGCYLLAMAYGFI